jgi:arylsulfatase A-like enzyme
MQRYLDRLDEIPMPNYEEGELDSKPGVQTRDHHAAYAIKGFFPFSQMNETDHKYIRAAYWAMCDLVDEQVGRMLAALERTGQLDNTMVIYMSDHGELLGDHGMYLKGLHFYEPSVHVPLIVSYPGVFQSNVRTGALTELLDIAPTLLEAAGLECAAMQGQSLWGLLTGGKTEHREDVYCELNDFAQSPHNGGYATMVRTDTHKLVVYHSTQEGELYDLQSDPKERVNLWSHSEHGAVKLQMMERLCHRLAGTADPLPPKVAPW